MYAMIISFPSSSSFNLTKIQNSKSPIYPKPLSSSLYSFSCSSNLKNQTFHYKNQNPHQKRLNFKSCAIPGYDFSGFDSVQPVVEAAAVLTAIIVVHESGHFLAAYLQGIRVSKFAVGFGPILAKFNANNVEYSLRAFPLGGFVGFPDNDRST